MRTLFFLLPVLALGACSASAPSGVAANGDPVLHRDSVVVYESHEDIPDVFEVLGVAQASQQVRSVGVTRVVSGEELAQLRREPSARAQQSGFRRHRVEQAKRDAARLGANGILIVTEDDLIEDPRFRQALGSAGQGRDDRLLFIYVGSPPARGNASDPG